MRVVLDRKTGTICAAGVVVRVDPTGEVLRLWFMQAIREGWDFTGRTVEMWDLGANERTTPMHCLTINAERFLAPPKKEKRP